MIWFLIYYVVVVLYTLVLLILKKPSVWLQFLLLVSVPFAGILLVAALLWKNDKQTGLPEWLIRREQFADSDWLVPDKEKEKNIVPFSDALYLNSSLLRRQLLIDMLKKQTHVKQDVLKQALENDDSETAHYAAVAIQKSKNETLQNMAVLETRVKTDPEDIVAWYELKNEIRYAIDLEFLDETTEKQLRHKHLDILSRIKELAPQRDLAVYEEIVEERERLGWVDSSLEQLSEEVLTYFPDSEDAYMLSMKIAYLLNNQSMLQTLVKTIRASSLHLSPAGLQKLRFWM